MRKLLVLFICLLPLPALAQYIGNPAGKAVPLGATKRKTFFNTGYAGVEGGYQELKVKAEYDAIDGTIREVSQLEEGYFAFYGGAHMHGFELDAKIGGTFQELKETTLINDPYQNGAGIIVGTSARYGFSPIHGVRLGLGGQFSYSDSRGKTTVTDRMGREFSEPIDLELFRGQVFGGISLDLMPRKGLCFSPYVGIGGEFIWGNLVFRRWDGWYVYTKDVGDIDEENPFFGYLGLDLFVSRGIRLGFEAKGNQSGFGAMGTIGYSF